MKQPNTGERDKVVKPESRSRYDIPPIIATPEELARSMFRNAHRKLAEKKSQTSNKVRMLLSLEGNDEEVAA